MAENEEKYQGVKDEVVHYAESKESAELRSSQSRAGCVVTVGAMLVAIGLAVALRDLVVVVIAGLVILVALIAFGNAYNSLTNNRRLMLRGNELLLQDSSEPAIKTSEIIRLGWLPDPSPVAEGPSARRFALAIVTNKTTYIIGGTNSKRDAEQRKIQWKVNDIEALADALHKVTGKDIED